MTTRIEWRALSLYAALFAGLYFVPLDLVRSDNALVESFRLVQWYAREHVILCLIPAFFIAGAIAVFVSQSTVIAYLGAGAKQVLAYSVAAVSGSVLAVCSCTILPLFAGIYRMGAGIGPATAFLYAGPAVNVLAIILTASVLGWELGVARAVGATVFSVVIGLLMQLIFRKEEAARIESKAIDVETPSRPLWKSAVFFGTMVLILVTANWGHTEAITGLWAAIGSAKWYLTGFLGIVLSFTLVRWFRIRWFECAIAGLPVLGLAIFFPHLPHLAFLAASVGLSVVLLRNGGEAGDWWAQSWGLAKQMLPLLLIGILVSGLLLGRPGHGGLIPSAWISQAVGGNSLMANLFASVAGAFMYFATLTEVPILQGLLGSGMGKGPALALLLAGPALSLPNMLVIRSVMGTRRTIVYVSLVMIMATISGLIFGSFFDETGVLF